MSRIGIKPVPVPKGVKIANDGKVLKIEGPKGKAEHPVSPDFDYVIEETTVKVSPNKSLEKNKKLKAQFGMERAMINSKITGVSEGFTKTLVLKGVGYRSQLQGSNKLNLTLGYSHPVVFDIPEGVTAKVDGQTKIILESSDKQLVGETAAKIKTLRPPEPYKGKGIMHEDERIRRKAGKSAAGAKGGK